MVRTLLQKRGQTFAEEAGIRLAENTPAVLFQHLCLSLLLGARIPAANALEATRALIDAGLTTPQKMKSATWQDRVDVITWHGYKRYDESGSTKLGEAAALLLDNYEGDLRNLRDAAERDVSKERTLLQEFKGIGPVGADIFLREVQVTWDEAFPYADRKVLDGARRLHMSASPRELSKLVPRKDFARLTAAIIRTALARDYDEILDRS